jgi:3-phenylpropionate/cinnamic acid dioxygenase small subunit
MMPLKLRGTRLTADAAALYGVERFLIREARLLDERRYLVWLETLHPDIEYIVFSRSTLELREQPMDASVDPEFQAKGGLQVTEESKQSLTFKIHRITGGLSFSEMPPGRTVRFVTNIEAVRDEQGRLIAESCFQCNRTRKGDRVENFYARRKDVLIESAPGSFLLLQRHVFLNESVMDGPTTSIFF